LFIRPSSLGDILHGERKLFDQIIYRRNMTHTINRTVALFASFALIALALPAFAATPNWELQEDTALVFTCNAIEYPHTLETVTQDEEGMLTGTGSYDTNTAYTWDMEGSVDGDNVSMTLTYTGLLAGSVYNLEGVVAPDGSIMGTADGNCQTFTMPAGSAVAIEDEEPVANVPTSKDDCKEEGWMDLTDTDGNAFKNQGQCVSYVATGQAAL
jgi:hypothetical protein